MEDFRQKLDQIRDLLVDTDYFLDNLKTGETFKLIRVFNESESRIYNNLLFCLMGGIVCIALCIIILSIDCLLTYKHRTSRQIN